MDTLHTKSLHELIVRFQHGDVNALDALIRRTSGRLECFARRTLDRFPAVGAREQLEDVLQGMLVRLAGSLRTSKPGSVREYYALASELVRRELIDLHRRHIRRPAQPILVEPSRADSTDLDLWTALHEAVERLPGELREIFCLVFYQDCKQAVVAELLGISDRQVRRWWAEACAQLKEAVRELPTA